MDAHFRARWVSKKRSDEIRRAGTLGDGFMLSSCKGIILVEPKTQPMGDGPILSHDAASYEIDPTWCTDSPAKVKKAREMIGLEVTRRGR